MRLIKEKIVELCEDLETLPCCDTYEGQAEYLIANGVTVQEWISVDDRLPEQGEKAICIDADGDMMIGKYTEWGWMFPCYFEELTHWMPIPEPPKGE